MKFGVSVSNFGHLGKEAGVDGCIAIAERAEELGFDSVWVHDHIIIPERIQARYPYNETGQFGAGWQNDIFEPLVLLSALAARTSRVKLGTSVLVIPYRDPVLTAKMLSVADCLSNGRLILGVGVGWMEDEFRALNLPDDYYPHRGTVTTEYIKAIKELWTNTGPSSFHGRYVRFKDIGMFPKPVQKPHPPIVVGGKGEAAMLRAVRLGTGFQAIAANPDQLAGEVAELRRLCQKDRRDPDELEVSILAGIRLTSRPHSDGPRPPLTGTPDEVISDLRRYGKSGLTHIVATPRSDEGQTPLAQILNGMEMMAQEILPAFR